MSDVKRYTIDQDYSALIEEGGEWYRASDVDDLRKRLAAAEKLLLESRSKFNELYLTLATEDLCVQDLRELRTLADQGGLAIDSAMQEASHG